MRDKVRVGLIDRDTTARHVRAARRISSDGSGTNTSHDDDARCTGENPHPAILPKGDATIWGSPARFAPKPRAARVVTEAKGSHIQQRAPASAATQATGGAGTKPGKAAGREGAVDPRG